MHPRANHRKQYWEEHDKDEYACPDCGREKGEVSEFQVHHKDGNATNGNMSNLVALCRKCHHNRHGDWIENYQPKGIYKRDRRYIRVTR
jgi:5-methylcytosine-specific restriction endonuclease McrA